MAFASLKLVKTTTLLLLVLVVVAIYKYELAADSNSNFMEVEIKSDVIHETSELTSVCRFVRVSVSVGFNKYYFFEILTVSSAFGFIIYSRFKVN